MVPCIGMYSKFHHKLQNMERFSKIYGTVYCKTLTSSSNGQKRPPRSIKRLTSRALFSAIRRRHYLLPPSFALTNSKQRLSCFLEWQYNDSIICQGSKLAFTSVSLYRNVGPLLCRPTTSLHLKERDRLEGFEPSLSGNFKQWLTSSPLLKERLLLVF